MGSTIYVVSEAKKVRDFGSWKKKRIPSRGGLLRKKASFEFHRGFENRGSGALLFVLQTLIVSAAVSW